MNNCYVFFPSHLLCVFFLTCILIAKHLNSICLKWEKESFLMKNERKYPPLPQWDVYNFFPLLHPIFSFFFHFLFNRLFHPTRIYIKFIYILSSVQAQFSFFLNPERKIQWNLIFMLQEYFAFVVCCFMYLCVTCIHMLFTYKF